jgi:hypothetical protein
MSIWLIDDYVAAATRAAGSRPRIRSRANPMRAMLSRAADATGRSSRNLVV